MMRSIMIIFFFVVLAFRVLRTVFRIFHVQRPLTLKLSHSLTLTVYSITLPNWTWEQLIQIPIEFVGSNYGHVADLIAIGLF